MDTKNLRDILTQMQKTLECSICLELLSNPVSTKCDHRFCSFCITKFLQRKRSVPCPLCNKPVTKRGIQERKELSLVINNVRQLIAAYEADTKEKFTPSKNYRQVQLAEHNRKASDRQTRAATQTTGCQVMDTSLGNSESASVPVGGNTGQHSPVTDSVPRTRSRSRQVVCSDTGVNVPAGGSSRRQSNGDVADISRHRRPGRKRKLSFQSMTSDNGDESIAEQKEKLNDNLVEYDVHKMTRCTDDSDHQVSNADILRYLEEGSCGAIQGVIPANGNENHEHVPSVSEWQANAKKEPANISQKCDRLENILQPGSRRRPNRNMNNSSKEANKDCTDPNYPVPNSPILSADTSQNIVGDKICNDSKGNEALKLISEQQPVPLHSNDKAVKDVSVPSSPSSDVSSVSSTQQLLKPKPVTARTYSRDIRKSFHDSFVKNWADTLPQRNVVTNNLLNQRKGLTTKEKIYAKKQKVYQSARLQEQVTNEDNIPNNMETLMINKSDSLQHPATPKPMFEPPLAQMPNRKSIFKSRTQTTGNKSCVLDGKLSSATTNKEDPFEFQVGHTPVKSKRITSHQNRLKTDETKVSDCKAQNKNKKMNVRKCEVVAVTQRAPLKHVSASRQECALDSSQLNLSSIEVEENKMARLCAAAPMTLETHETSSCVQVKNLLNPSTRKNKTVHFEHDIVGVDTDVHLTQGDMSVTETHTISTQVNATIALDSQTNQHSMQHKAVQLNDARELKKQTSETGSLTDSTSKLTVVQELQPEDSLNADKNVTVVYSRDSLVNESTEFLGMSVDVALMEAPHKLRNKQKNKTQQSFDIDASCLLPDSTRVRTPVEKRKFARRRKTLTSPDTETFSQKAGKELAKLIHKINEAEDYEFMFSTQEAQKKLQEDLQKEQMLVEAFGFATQDSDHGRFNESRDKTENKTANSTETGHAHRVLAEMVDQSDHMEQINTQEHPIRPSTKQNTNSAMQVLEKISTHTINNDLEASDKDDKSVSTSKDIDNTSVVTNIDISLHENDDFCAGYQGEGRIDSSLLEPVELDSSRSNLMLQPKSHISLHTKQHVATTPVGTRRTCIFPRPNFSEMVQVSPCAKGVLTPTNPTLTSRSVAELHTSDMATVSSKTSAPNMSICEQPQVKQGGHCDQNVNSTVQPSLTSNIIGGNKVKEGQDFPDLNTICMHSHNPISYDKISNHNPTVSADANTNLGDECSVDIKTRFRKSVNTTQLSLKSKDTSGAEYVSPGKNSEIATNDAQGCDIILALDTCLFSTSYRTTGDGSNHAEEEAGVILETLDFDTNIQHTTDVHSDHIATSPLSLPQPQGFDAKSASTTAATTNTSSEEAIAESEISASMSTQGPIISPQDSSLKTNMNTEISISWTNLEKTEIAYPNTAALINLSSEKNNVIQSTAIVVISQETTSGCSAFSQSILLPPGACDIQGVIKNDLSHSDNSCSRLQKLSLDKSTSASDNLSKSLCLTVPETPGSRASPKNHVSSAPCRTNCSESEDDDIVLIVRRKKRKCFSLDGSPLKPVVFGSDQKLLEDNLAPEDENDECDVDMIGETEAMGAIDTWTERDLEDCSGMKVPGGCVSESFTCQQEGTKYLTEMRGAKADRNSIEHTVDTMSPELLELPAKKLHCIDSSEKLNSGLNDVNSVPFSKPKSQKQLFSPRSEAHLARHDRKGQVESNSSDHRNDMTALKLSDNVNEDNEPNKPSEDVPETVMSQDDDDDDVSHENGNNRVEDLLVDTELDISLSENAAERSAIESRPVSYDLEKAKQTKRGLAKKGCLNLDTSVKHPRGLLSPASKANVKSGIEKLPDEKNIAESDADVIYIDTVEEDIAGVARQNRTLVDAIPDGSKMCDGDFEIVDPGNVAGRQQKGKKLPVETKGKKSQIGATENKYCNAKKQLEKELFGLESQEKFGSREETDRKQEMPAGGSRQQDVEKAAHTCVRSVYDKADDELLFDLGDSSDDEIMNGAPVKTNAKPPENKNQKSEVSDQLDDSVSMSGCLPVTSSPVQTGNSLEHEHIDQSIINTVDETDVDDEDGAYVRPKSRVKRLQIASDSEDSNQEANPAHGSTNTTSSSAFSSQSEMLNTEQQEAMEQDVARLHQQIAEYEAKLVHESENLQLTPATQEEMAGVKAASGRRTSDNADEDEDSDDLFVSPLSPSPPPPRQPSIKPVAKRPAHPKLNRQTDQYIKQFQSPGGTVRTKKSLEFTINTTPSLSESGNKANSLLEMRPFGLTQENNIKNVPKKPCSDRVLHDITHMNTASVDEDKMPEVIDINDPSEVQLSLSPVILSQKSRQITSESDKRDGNSLMTSRILKYHMEKDICLVASALGREENLLVVKLAERYGLKFTSKFSAEVTHVVMKPAAGYDRVCDRTLKFFQGVAYKCWVVAFSWVQDSLQTGSLLPEEDYEIIGDTSGGENTFGAKHSRLSREHLFADFCLACVGGSSEMPKEILHELLNVCGATIVDDPIGLLSKVAKYKIIVRCSDSNIAPTTAELDMFNGLYKHMGLLTVMREWVLDSLGAYKLQPLIEYVLNTGVTSVPF